MVSPQQPVAVIGDTGNFILELQVDEYDLSRIQLGQKVVVGLDSYKGQAFEAVVTRIEPLVNERTRSLTIEAEFTPKSEGRMRITAPRAGRRSVPS